MPVKYYQIYIFILLMFNIVQRDDAHREPELKVKKEICAKRPKSLVNTYWKTICKLNIIINDVLFR